MGEKALKFSERFFFLMVWIVIALIAAGVLLHLANSKGVLPGFIRRGLEYTNLSQQAGS